MAYKQLSTYHNTIFMAYKQLSTCHTLFMDYKQRSTCNTLFIAYKQLSTYYNTLFKAYKQLSTYYNTLYSWLISSSQFTIHYSWLISSSQLTIHYSWLISSSMAYKLLSTYNICSSQLARYFHNLSAAVKLNTPFLFQGLSAINFSWLISSFDLEIYFLRLLSSSHL